MLNEAQLLAVGQHIGRAVDAGDVEIASIQRFHGGASRETYAIDVLVKGSIQAMILRCEPKWKVWLT